MRLVSSTLMMCALAVRPAFAQDDPVAGERAYEVCAGCHGFLGEGNQTIGAPRLAGIEGWYLERQITNFRDGRRGHVDGDVNGARMALMAQAVDSERELGDLLAWIDSLPEPGSSSGTAQSGADVSSGQRLYAPCSACHGSERQGNESLGAPGLVSLDGWYFAEQLKAYADGLRGTHPSDSYGAQMRALATSFDTEDERQDLARYVMTLQR
ncbi:MAG: c-type cytochrome [Gammaproteobacteria bacterium]|nr:c-type cytochrome [Gammaproteobacteria bacterium]MDH3506962.1 c-type cytochrome [Gammaproteobacteria bacterium]